jgi:hypothetical protein
LRRGLDRYLHDQFPHALSCYLHGGELGEEDDDDAAVYLPAIRMLVSDSTTIRNFFFI